MKAQKAGSNRLVIARLRAYDDALKSGFSREEAMREAKSVTRKAVNKKHREAGR